jgi:PST family polysaccharide transporter
MLYMRIDQVMLAEMIGERQVGFYSAALRLSEPWYIIAIIIVGSVAPTITEVRVQSQELYYQRLQQLFTTLTRIAYVVAIPMTLISTHLVIWLYGEQYANAGPVLAVHIWTAVFVFLGVAAGPWVLNEGLAKFSLYQTVLGALTNISLNLILIPLYGAIGCAVATLISQALAAWLSNVFFDKTAPLFKLQLSALLLCKR